jgi:hypothetical protein
MLSGLQLSGLVLLGNNWLRDATGKTVDWLEGLLVLSGLLAGESLNSRLEVILSPNHSPSELTRLLSKGEKFGILAASENVDSAVARDITAAMTRVDLVARDLADQSSNDHRTTY